MFLQLKSSAFKRILSGSAWYFIGTASHKACMFSGAVLVARQLSTSEFGEFGIIRSTLMTFLVFAGLGLGSTASRFISQYKHSDKIKAGRIYSLSTSSAAIIGLAMALALWSFSEQLAYHSLNNPDIVGLIRISSFAVFLAQLL